MMPDDSLAAEFAPFWKIKKGVTYLNHGSFGPSPEPVIQAAANWTRELEMEPCEFFQRRSPELLAGARRRLGEFVGADAADLLYVANATFGGNIVARSLRFEPGDEILTTDHEYGAMTRMWEFMGRTTGAKLKVQSIPFPIRSHDETVDALFAGLTDRTKLVFVSHVTSPTGLIFPVKAIVERAHRRGVPVFIDGAHAPGMFPLNLSEIGAEMYTGNCHKWMAAPFGSGFLHAVPEFAGKLEPLVVGWGKQPGKWEKDPLWQREFEWLGTRDYAPFLATPTAIDFLEIIGVERLAEHSHGLVRYARQRVAEMTQLEPICPDDLSHYGSMAAMPMPPGDRAELQDALWHRFGIEIPVVEWQGRRFVRVSAHAYTTVKDIDRLMDALKVLLG